MLQPVPPTPPGQRAGLAGSTGLQPRFPATRPLSTAAAQSHASSHSTRSSQPPARPRHGPTAGNPPQHGKAGPQLPFTPPALPTGERARSPHSHAAVGEWRDQAAACWGGPGGEEGARCQGSRLLLRPRCPLKTFAFLWGQGTERFQPRVVISPSAAHRYTACCNHSFSFTGTRHRTRLFVRSVMR